MKENLQPYTVDAKSSPMSWDRYSLLADGQDVSDQDGGHGLQAKGDLGGEAGIHEAAGSQPGGVLLQLSKHSVACTTTDLLETSYVCAQEKITLCWFLTIPISLK